MGKSWDSGLLLALIVVALEPGGAIVISQFAGLMGGVLIMGALTLIVWIVGRLAWTFFADFGRVWRGEEPQIRVGGSRLYPPR